MPTVCLGKRWGVLVDRVGITRTSGEEGTRRTDGDIWGIVPLVFLPRQTKGCRPTAVVSASPSRVSLLCPCLEP